MKYELKTSDDGLNKLVLRYNENGTISHIPTDLANSDYQAYLAAQSTPSIPEGGN
jgi:hypothetical protein